MKLLLATSNPNKLREIRALLNVPGLEILGALDFPDMPEVVEDGDTFEANAVKKARAMSQVSGTWALADDSGLEVDALNGEPGVYSARYAGEVASSSDNNRKLLSALEGVENRAARFRCVLALVSPEGTARTLAGACEGSIAFEPRGDGGFGYDPLFIPEGHDRVFAEMSGEEKNKLSHRGRALAKARVAWKDLLVPQE